jgi:predicted nucleotidyltransferase
MTKDRGVRSKFEATLESFIQQVKQDEYIVAAILFGSLVDGDVWEKSDIDLVLVTKDVHSPYKDLWITENGINIQVSVFSRNQFIRSRQRALHGSTTHHVYTTSRILFSKDETIIEFLESMHKIGLRDLQLQMLHIISMVIGDVEKAEKFLVVKNDVVQSYLFITRLLDHLAQIVVMLNNEISGREAVEQATKYEPELFREIFTKVVIGKADKEKLHTIIQKVRSYLAEKTPTIFRLVINYMREEGTFRSASEIAQFLNDQYTSDWWNIAVLGICDWLVEQGYLQKIPCSTRLTNRSRVEMNETGYFYVGEESFEEIH